MLLHEEFYAHPQQALREVFAFLGVKEDVNIDTSVRYNLSGAPKSRMLYAPLNHFIFNPSPLEKCIKSLVPSRLRSAWASKAIGMLTRTTPLDQSIQAQLKAYFAEDVAKLEDLLHRDLRRWRYLEPSLAQQP